MSALMVTNAGVQSTIQDGGRSGYLHMGIPESGSMDRWSAHCANALCGNELTNAVIEVTLGGLELRAQGSCVIAVTGGFATLQINGKFVEMWCSHMVKQDDHIQLGYCQKGARLYVAVSGGIQTDPVLGSQSTTVQWGIGGLSGGALEVDDVVSCGTPLDEQTRRLSVAYRPRLDHDLELAVLPCAQHEQFSTVQQELFFNTIYRVDERCNRMGYRILGDALNPPKSKLYSEGLTVGAIQVPPDGQPIILMRDHQSIGGYPKIASLLSPEIDRLAQCTAGHQIRFVPVTLEQAQQWPQKYRNELALLPSLVTTG